MPEADPNKKETPSIDVAAITKSVTEEVTKAIKTDLDVIRADQKVLADTLAATKPAEKAPADKGEKKDAEALTAEKVVEISARAVEAALKSRDEAAGKTAERAKIVEKLVKEKLGGDADLGALIQGADEAALTASADALAKKIQALKPDFGGATKDGGKAAADAPAKGNVPAVAALSDGARKFAEGIKLPA